MHDVSTAPSVGPHSKFRRHEEGICPWPFKWQTHWTCLPNVPTQHVASHKVNWDQLLENYHLFSWAVSFLCTASELWIFGRTQSEPWLVPEATPPAPPDKECRWAPPAQLGWALFEARRLCKVPSAPWHSWRSKQNSRYGRFKSLTAVFRPRAWWKICTGSAHHSADATGSPCAPLSGMLSYSILFDSMKFFCIADIWAMIFCLWSFAASAFRFLSAFSLSWTLWRKEQVGTVEEPTHSAPSTPQIFIYLFIIVLFTSSGLFVSMLTDTTGLDFSLRHLTISNI